MTGMLSGHIAEIFPMCYKRKVIWATWRERCNRLTREMQFSPHGIKEPLVLRKKCVLYHVKEVLHKGCKSHSIFYTWQIYSGHLAVY